MFMSTPRAPSMDTSSSSGLVMAFMAASRARDSPRAMPAPIMARPDSPITAFTSAKSRLMRPGTMIRSEMPFTAKYSTSSAFFSISTKVAFLGASDSRRSLGMVIRLSTCSRNSEMPSSAASRRFLPSKKNGLVTTPTVSAPISLAACAMTGAAPVPVPPPMPAVTKTMSASPMASLMAPMLSRAASRPMPGLAPAPRPLVSLSPSWILSSAEDRLRAWISVLAAMKVTPFSAEDIMFWTALPPPPPTPMTLIFAVLSASIS